MDLPTLEDIAADGGAFPPLAAQAQTLLADLAAKKVTEAMARQAWATVRSGTLLGLTQ